MNIAGSAISRIVSIPRTLVIKTVMSIPKAGVGGGGVVSLLNTDL